MTVGQIRSVPWVKTSALNQNSSLIGKVPPYCTLIVKSIDDGSPLGFVESTTAKAVSAEDVRSFAG